MAVPVAAVEAAHDAVRDTYRTDRWTTDRDVARAALEAATVAISCPGENHDDPVRRPCAACGGSRVLYVLRTGLRTEARRAVTEDR